MPISILMPALSPTMTEGNLLKWLKKEGDPVKAGDVLAEIETDKATMEVEAVDEGTVGKILVPANTENVKVNQPIAVLLEEGEDASALASFTPAMPPSEPIKEAAPTPAATPSFQPPRFSSRPSPAGRVFASPLARRLAEQAKVNLNSIKGSGPHGRIVKADVEEAATRGSVSTPSPTSFLTGHEPAYDVLPVSGMRKVIAKRLLESKQMIPHFYLTIDCDIDALLQAREHINAQAKEGDYKLSVNDFVIKACAVALEQVPAANASWMGDQIYQYKSSDIAVAVAIEGGLITPIIREAETKGLVKISNEMKELALKARAGKLTPAEFQGGTFSISNLGMYGIREFAAIVNPPQSCILAVGQGEKRAVVRDGTVTAATLMTCTLSADHRVVDGAVGAQFLKAFKELIENPVTIML